MKKSLFLSIIFVLLCSLIFSSCQDFLGGANLKEQIEDEIYWTTEKDTLSIQHFSPVYQSNGEFCDSPIEIVFNKSINPSTFKYSIKDGLSDISNDYTEPQFYNNNTVVKLRLKENASILNFDVGTIRDITFTIEKDLLSTDGSRFSKENYIYTFRLNHKLDNISPDLSELSLYKFNNKDKLDNIDLSNFDKNNLESKDFYEKNLVSTFYIHCKARDNGIGLKYARVTEELLFDSTGSTPAYKVLPITKDIELSVTPVESDSSLYYGEGLYSFETHEDGIFKLSIQALDANKNSSAQTITYYVIKFTDFNLDTQVGYSYYQPIIYNGYGEYTSPQWQPTSESSDYNLKFDPQTLQSFESSEIVIKNLIDTNWFMNFYSNMIEDYSFTVQIGDSFENLGKAQPVDFVPYFSNGEKVTSANMENKEDYINQNSENDYKEYLLDIEWKANNIKYSDLSNDIFMVVSVHDKAGNHYDVKVVIPKKSVYYTAADITTYYENQNYTNYDRIKQRKIYLEKTANSNPDTDLYTCWDDYFDGTFNIPEDKTYYVYYQTYYNYSNYFYNRVYGPLSNRYEICGKDILAEYDNLEAPKVSYSLDRQNNKLILTASLNDNYDATQFDAYYLENPYPYNYYDDEYYSSRHIFTKNSKTNKYTCSVELEYDSYYINKNYKFKVFGIKNSTKIYSEDIYYFTLTEDYNYIAPYAYVSGSNNNVISSYFNGINVEVRNTDKAKPSYTTIGKTPKWEKTYVSSPSYQATLRIFETENGRKLSNAYIYNSNHAQMVSPKDLSFYDFTLYYAKGKNISDEDIINERVKIYKGNTLTGIPQFLFEEGVYYLRLKIENINGDSEISDNTKIQIVRKKGYNLEFTKGSIQQPSIPAKVSTTGSQYYARYMPFSISFKDSNNNSINEKYASLQYFLEDFNYWCGRDIYYDHADCFTAQKNNNKNNFYFDNLNLDNCFIRVSLNNFNGTSEWDPENLIYYAPKYIYLDNLAGTQKYPDKCSIKNLIDGTYTLTLLFDAPVFIHTIYADHNLGSDIDDWELQGISLNDQVVKPKTDSSGNPVSDMKNISIDTSNIPKGNYYTTVVWFADGTNTMSSVKYKE